MDSFWLLLLVTAALSLRCYHVNSQGMTTTPAVSEDILTTVADASSASTSKGPAANATTQSNNSNATTGETSTTNGSTTNGSTTEKAFTTQHHTTTEALTIHINTTEASTTQSPTEVSTNEATTKTQTTNTSTTEASTTQSPTMEPTEGPPTENMPTTNATTEASTTQSPTMEPTEGPPTKNMPTTNAATTEASTTQSPTEVSTNEATTKTQTTNTSPTEASTTQSPTMEPTEGPPTENMPTTNAATTEVSTTQSPTMEPTEGPPTKNMPTTNAATTEASTTQSPTEVSTNEATTKTQITVEELLQQVTVNLSLEESQTILKGVQTILDSDSEVAEASDLISLVDVYATIGNTDKLQNATLEDSKSFVQASLSVANSLLDDRYTGFYQDANSSSEAETISPASKVVSTTEQLMRSLAEQILAEDGESFNSSNDNIATEIKKWDGSGNPDEPLSVPAEDQFSKSIATQAIIPAELFMADQGRAIVSVLYRNLDKVIGNSSQTDVEEVFASGKSGNTSAEIAVLSKVLSISVVPRPADMSFFKKFPVNMTFQTRVQQINAERPDDLVVDTDTAACVYWDLTNSSGGSWSSSGCSFIRGNANYTMCACRHLTSFAVLMQVTDIKISKSNQMALNIISYIGCSLSVVGVILLVGTFVFLNILTERVLVHINLAIAVGLARFMFLLLDSPPRHTDGCIAVAMVIYYTNMASFFWMLIEGVHLYLQVVVVFNIERSKLRLYMPVAWGVPIILTAVTVGVFSNSIRKSDVCWLQSSDNSIWMFVAPMLAVVAANTFILIRVVRVIFKLTAANATSGLSQTKQVAKATLLLQPVLGVTWIFGVLSLSSSLLVFQYLFTICNSLQGVLLFLFYCVFNSEVRDTFKRRKANWEMFNRSTKSSTVGPLTDFNRSTSYNHQSQGGSGTAVESSVLPLEDVPTFR